MINRCLLYISISLLSVISSCKKDSENNHNTDYPEGYLHAERGAKPGIYDESGRFILLRGVNYNVLGDYWAANPDVATVAEYNPDHFREMAAYGFNCVRLLFHWSKLEPERGQYNAAYIDEICKAVEDAGKHGVYVMLDLHQDAYGKYIASPASENCEKPNKGWDGAPDWATFTDGESTCTTDGSRESAPAVYHAWQNFWDNKEGIRDACIAVWQEVIKKAGKYNNVIGYDLLNEPSLGYSSLADQNKKMFSFYGQLTKAIRATEAANGIASRIIFFEPSVTFKGGGLPTVPSQEFTNDNNIVFAPHNYFEVITQGILTIEQGFELYNGISGFYKTHTFIGEWGVYGDPSVDVAKLKRFAAAEDKFFNGSTWWQWSQAPGDPHGISWDGSQYDATSLHLVEVDVNGKVTPKRNQIYLDVLRRARPIAIHGAPQSLVSNPENGELTLKAKATSKGITELWIPDKYGTPQISGTNVSLKELKTVDGGFKAYVEVGDSYTVNVRY